MTAAALDLGVSRLGDDRHNGLLLVEGNEHTIRCATCPAGEDGKLRLVAQYRRIASTRPDKAATVWARHIAPPRVHDRNRRVLIVEAIRSHVAEHGYPPSVRELGAVVGLVSPSSVAYQLKQLELAGVIRRTDRARAIALVEPGHPSCEHCGCGGTP